MRLYSIEQIKFETFVPRKIIGHAPLTLLNQILNNANRPIKS